MSATLHRIGTMIILNLFIGVIMKGMEEAQAEDDERVERERFAGRATGPEEAELDLEADLRSLEQQIDGLKQQVRTVAIRARARVA